MRSLLRTPALSTAVAVAAAVAIYLFLTLPPAAVPLGGTLPDTVAAGAFHVHSDRSDGTGSVDAIAAAAARAGLQYVVLTDHGDGTRPIEPPSYRHGVLLIDAVEVNTVEGHVIALGLGQATPFPLAGDARDVIEDIHRFGGVAVAAHPDSPRADLRWRAAGRSTSLDGIEWINLDSEWRDESSWQLFSAGVRSLVRGPESITSLLTRPVRTFQRWDQSLRQRPVFSVAALDAHASIGWREQDEPRSRAVLSRPTYESMFETLVQNVMLDAPLSGDAARDASRVTAALISGRSYSVVRALAWPASLEFSARAGDRDGSMGDTLESAEGVRLLARVPQAPGVDVTILRDGRSAATGRGSASLVADGPGAYRVEVVFPGAKVPWMVSNAIRLIDGRSGEQAAVAENVTEPEDWHAMNPADARWTIEKDGRSTGAVRPSGDGTVLDFALAPGEPSGQYVALAGTVGTTVGIDRIAFTGAAEQPRRISVQFRLAGRRPERWRHSVYVDRTPRRIVLNVREFQPADGGTSQRPNVVPLASLLFVVDTVNARPGARGAITISDVRLGVDRLRDPAAATSGR